MKTLDRDILDEIVQRLAAEFQPEQIYLFGSHAWGEPEEGSDFDLYVIVSQSAEKPIERVKRARRCLGRTGVATDILVKTRAEAERFRSVRASLEFKIFHEGVKVYG
ncbi:MAG: nucleotidyltransferase domain-containing protein [Pirellulales bacterium]|nr:nucleotidyltransferase domain-containing protein [Pirellulales bacterium]